MNMKQKRWLFLLLWTAVVAIILSDIVAVAVVQPHWFKTYLVAFLIAFIPFMAVYGLQVLITQHKNPFTLFNEGVL